MKYLKKIKYINLLFYVALILILTAVGTIIQIAKPSSDYNINYLKSNIKYSTNCEFLKNENDCKIYVSYYNEKILAYSVVVSEKGFSNYINFIISIDGNNKICDINILNKYDLNANDSIILSEDYLNSFKNKKLSEIDKNSNNSNSLLNAISKISSLNTTISSIEKELNKEIILSENIIDNSTDIDISNETTVDETTSKGDDFYVNTDINDKKKVTDTDNSSNNNNGSGNMSIDGKDVTTVYETETKKSDTTNTISTSENKTDTTVKSEITTKTPGSDSIIIINPVKHETTAETTSSEETTGIPEDTTGVPEETTGTSESEG